MSSSVVRLSIQDLRAADSPRLRGLDTEHVRTLAEVIGLLPPIAVHRSTLMVVDGMHRLAAARLRGRSDIDAVLVDCAVDEVFRLSIEANIANGKPLSLADRRAAAARLMRTHPELSDRSIARSVGMAPATVASIRAAVEGPGTGAARVGADGRIRPRLAAEGRLTASTIIAERPNASLRTIAREAGISVSTALDVRKRVLAGAEPVPTGSRPVSMPLGPEPSATEAARRPQVTADLESLMGALRRDPMLRYSDSGRDLLRWLDQGVAVAGQCQDKAEAIPVHCIAQISQLLRQCTKNLAALAEVLDARRASAV
ncbi:ParB/RepB/Spo0J family partition protein [Catenulispora subtropica]